MQEFKLFVCLLIQNVYLKVLLKRMLNLSRASDVVTYLKITANTDSSFASNVDLKTEYVILYKISAFIIMN